MLLGIASSLTLTHYAVQAFLFCLPLYTGDYGRLKHEFGTIFRDLVFGVTELQAFL